MDDNNAFWLEREALRQRLTEQGATKDSIRFMQLYSALDHERRSALMRIATRLLVAQRIERFDNVSVSPDSDAVSDEIDSRIEAAKPYDQCASMLTGLNDYTCNVRECFFPDGTEVVIVRCSLGDKEIGENFENVYQDQVALARNYQGAGNLPTQDEHMGRRELGNEEAKWRRALDWEEWIRDWRDALFRELLESAAPR